MDEDKLVVVLDRVRIQSAVYRLETPSNVVVAVAAVVIDAAAAVPTPQETPLKPVESSPTRSPITPSSFPA